MPDPLQVEIVRGFVEIRKREMTEDELRCAQARVWILVAEILEMVKPLVAEAVKEKTEERKRGR